MGKNKFIQLLAGFLLTGANVCASAAEVKVGIIAPLSGQFAKTGETWREGIAVYQKLHGDSVGGNKVTFVYRDLPDVNPSTARALAQELVVREGVQYLGGLFYTPDAVAVAQVSEQAKVPTVVFNAATSSLIDRSKYLLRVSYTQPQVTVPMAQFALKEGFKSVATIVSDYASGADVEKNFETAFTAGGGKITIKIRAPLDTIDFSPFMQTIKNSKPQAVLAFTPGGVISIGFVKAFRDVGLQTEGVRLLGIGGEVDEASVLPALGDIALGTYSSNFYVPTRRSASNDAFSQSFKGLFPNSAIGPTTLEAFDGMSLLYRMIGATNGKRDPDAAMVAAKGYKWESPRGPMEVDASNRDLIQNVYIRKVEKSASGAMFNNLVQTYEHQPDYGRINEGRTTGPAKAP